MKYNIRSLLVAVMATAGLVLAMPASVHAQDEKTYEFRIQTAVPNSSLYFEILQDFAANVERMSGGRLEAKVLPDGAEVSAFDIHDAVHDGVVEAGYAWPHYWSGKHSAYVLFSNPPASTGLDQRSFMTWYYRGGGQELYHELVQDIMDYNTVHFLVQPMGPDPLGWFSKPFKNLDEFRKLKYRAPPGIAGQTYSQMGIPAVAMPGGDIVPSAERGTIDAAEWIGPADDQQLGLSKIWNYYYLQGLHQQTDVGEIMFNKEWFDSLPDDLQAIIETATMAQVTETNVTNLDRNAQAVRDYQEQGISVLDTPEEYFPAFIEAQNQIIGDFIEGNDFFARVYKAQTEYAEKIYPYHSSNMSLWSNLVEEAHEARQKEEQE